MKSLLSVLLLLNGFFVCSNGIPDGSIWRYSSTFLNDKITFKEADTTINNRSYAKIKLLEKVVSYSLPPQYYWVKESEFFIRYDNDSMFYLSDSSEILLWTFRANINDTLSFGAKSAGFGCDSSTHIITGKGKQLVNNDSLQWIDIKPLSFTGFGYIETRIFEHIGPAYYNWFLPERILCDTENLTAIPEFPIYNLKCYRNFLLENYPSIEETCSKVFTSVFDKIEDLHIKYFPNPASNFIYIETNNASNYEYHLFDVVGNNIASPILVNDDIVKIDLNNFRNGYYLLRITDSNNNLISTKKLIIYK